jgi:hypothetical protein
MTHICRTLTIIRAINIVFNSDKYGFREQKFDFEQLKELDKYLYVTEDIVMFVIGLFKFEFENELEAKVTMGLLKHKNAVDNDMEFTPTTIFDDHYVILSNIVNGDNPYERLVTEILHVVQSKLYYSRQDIKKVLNELRDRSLEIIENQDLIRSCIANNAPAPPPIKKKKQCLEFENGDTKIKILKKYIETLKGK